MKTALKFILLFIIVGSGLFGLYYLFRMPDDKVMLEKLKACIDEKLPEATKFYQDQDVTLIEADEGVDWMDYQAIANFKIMKDETELPKQFVSIAYIPGKDVHSGKCQLWGSEIPQTE